MPIFIEDDEKLQHVECLPLPRFLRMEILDDVNTTNKTSFVSLRISIGSRCITASPYSAYFNSRIQQEAPTASVNTLIYQAVNIAISSACEHPKPSSASPTPSTIVSYCSYSMPLASLTAVKLGSLAAFRNTTCNANLYYTRYLSLPIIPFSPFSISALPKLDRLTTKSTKKK